MDTRHQIRLAAVAADLNAGGDQDLGGRLEQVLLKFAQQMKTVPPMPVPVSDTDPRTQAEKDATEPIYANSLPNPNPPPQAQNPAQSPEVLSYQQKIMQEHAQNRQAIAALQARSQQIDQYREGVGERIKKAADDVQDVVNMWKNFVRTSYRYRTLSNNYVKKQQAAGDQRTPAQIRTEFSYSQIAASEFARYMRNNGMAKQMAQRAQQPSGWGANLPPAGAGGGMPM